MSRTAVFACDTSAMTPEQRATHQQVLRSLLGAAVPAGLGFSAPAGRPDGPA